MNSETLCCSRGTFSYPCPDTCLPGNQGQLDHCSLTQHTLFRERLGTCLEKDKGAFTAPRDGHMCWFDKSKILRAHLWKSLHAGELDQCETFLRCFCLESSIILTPVTKQPMSRLLLQKSVQYAKAIINCKTLKTKQALNNESNQQIRILKSR